MKQKEFRLLAYPILTLFLLFIWLAVSKFGWNILLISIIAIFSLATLIYYRKVNIKTLKSSWAIIKFLFCLIINFSKGSIEIFILLITFQLSNKKQGMVSIPLTIEDNRMLVCLSLILSAAPGTIWVAYDKKNNLLHVHRLILTQQDKDDPCHLVRQHEKLLKEIF